MDQSVNMQLTLFLKNFTHIQIPMEMGFFFWMIYWIIDQPNKALNPEDAFEGDPSKRK